LAFATTNTRSDGRATTQPAIPCPGTTLAVIPTSPARRPHPSARSPQQLPILVRDFTNSLPSWAYQHLRQGANVTSGPRYRREPNGSADRGPPAATAAGG
jgi:hypothetical protein